MTDHDDEKTPDQPDEAANSPESEDAPTPATWAGRRRSSSEDAGEHPQLSEDEPAEEEGEAEESPDGGEQPQEDEPQAEDPEDDEPEDEPVEADEEEGGPDTEERLAQDTVETDTLSLGDREAAREAALAGLRARAAENKTKHGTGAITSPPPKTPAPVEAEGESADEPPEEPAPAAVAAAAEDEGPPRRRGIWPRFAVGSLLIIVAMATATSLSLFFFLNGVLHGFHAIAGVQNE